MTSSPPERRWLRGALLVESTFEALEAASGDAPYILDQGDLEEAASWVIAVVPIEAIKIAACRESPEERQKRLQVIRNVPVNELFRPILKGSMDGSVELLDGGHRIEVAVERGLTHISALVKLDYVPVMQGQSNKHGAGLAPESKLTKTREVTDELLSEAMRTLAVERAALYDDATFAAALERIEAQSTREGGSYTFDDGSQIIVDYMSGSVVATDQCNDREIDCAIERPRG